MSTQGPNGCGSGTNVTVGSSIAWTNPGNITLSDGSYATAALNRANPNGRSTQYLVASNFGFTIPVGSTINGILVEVERAAASSVGNPSDQQVQLATNPTSSLSLVGNNKASGTVWPTTEAYASYGGSADLWGWTPGVSDINSSGFCVYISAGVANGKGTNTVKVDYVRVTITYVGSVPPGGLAGGSMSLLGVGA
jgi:hypothetical protein